MDRYSWPWDGWSILDASSLYLWKWVVIFLTLSSSQLRGPQKVKLGGNDLYQVWVGKSKPVLNLGWFELVKFGLGSAFDSETHAEFGLDWHWLGSGWLGLGLEMHIEYGFSMDVSTMIRALFSMHLIVGSTCLHENHGMWGLDRPSCPLFVGTLKLQKCNALQSQWDIESQRSWSHGGFFFPHTEEEEPKK